MKIRYATLILLTFFCACTKKKPQDVSENKNISDRGEYFLKLSNQEKYSDEQRVKFLGNAFKLASNNNNTQQTRNLLSDIAFQYYNFNIEEGFDKSSKVLLKYSLSSSDSVNLGKAYRCRAFFYKNEQVLDSAFIYFSKAEKLYQKDQLTLANICLNKGVVQYLVTDFLGAELSLSRAYSIYKDSDNKRNLYGTLNQLGLVYNELKEYDKAVFYHTKALETVRQFNLQDENHQEAVCYNNLGYLYIKQKKYGEAIVNFEQGLKDKSILKDDPDLYSLLIDNLAYSRLESSNYEGLPKLFFDALEIRKKLNDPTVIVGSYIHISEYYQKKGDVSLSIKYSQDALNVAKASKIPGNIVLALKQAQVVDIKKSSKYSADYIRISDSLQIVERQSKDRFNRIRLETDEIIQEKDVLEGRNRRLLYVFIVTIILVSLLFVVRAQRARTRELLFKQNQQKANEEIFNLMMSQQSIIDESRNKEKKRLAQDLHDGVLGRMFGLRLNLDSLNSSTDADSMQKRLELLNELKTIEQDIREISHDLNREKMVLINNFVSIVHNLLEEQKSLHEANVEYHIETKIDWDKIGNAIKINLYRILQEGLQNINKYANAKEIKVDISGDAENVYLKIQDNGIGFDVNKKSKGIGMQNMISRTHDCQGIIDISSKKDHGTKIIITVPIETKQPIEA
ncbi:tetratricopeptide repeat-containing sensor histidine kinase [Flavobacterium wongokense]|uniref:tetratricopeptide repeat-containing sensor histidine kinase n=1 Tax=Flavobacterium wongokense TaxID=2910674 RepID=UPI001F263B86|nr:tetratricopeptide repeat protein [Flavobacterium sp. WG47]MCF6131298.1 tetratricopeptide repeat protein [Flavobacterium sp. WG47]